MNFWNYILVYLSLICIAININARSATEWGTRDLSEEQKKYPRVRVARQEKGAAIDSLFKAANLEYPGILFLRAFKNERKLELWAYSSNDTAYILLRTYTFTAYCGGLGPKRVQGDFQIPEGFYRIFNFNPASNFHLSLQIDYPNSSDKVLGEKGYLGGDIFIHGSNVTIGCIPLGDEAIKELYIMVLDSKDAGYTVPVHIFPCNFGDSTCTAKLEQETTQNPTLKAFWENLKEGYIYFETKHVLPVIIVDEKGKYIFKE